VDPVATEERISGPLWAPAAEQVAATRIWQFIESLRERGVIDARSYEDLYRWSLASPAEFWGAVWRYCGVIADDRGEAGEYDEVVVGPDRVAPPDREQGPKWFTGSCLNFAENLLRWRDDRPAIVSWDEGGPRARITHAELYREVARMAAALRGMGVVAGDRVAGLLPNTPHAVVAMLAATSIGAVWSSCSPDFGVNGVMDRFGQIEPKVLFAADGYRYNGREIDSLDRVQEIVARIPSLEQVVMVPWLSAAPAIGGIGRSVMWDDFASGTAEPLRFERLPFDHPLYIMYSSGTTGLPKCMVHGAGGTLVQHMKELVLHTDLGRDDRVFYFTTCGWMMWNWLVSALVAGSTIVLYDGSPLPAERKAILWDMAADEGVTVFGTSAKWLALAEKEGLKPAETHLLPALKAVLSTGSPLAAHSFDYVYRDVKRDVRLSSISGGTDIISCFAGGNPIGPVYRGELQALALAMRVEVFDDGGRSLGPGEGAGELVCTMSFPSMPVAFWNDPEGSKYHAAYFARYPNVWRHGDWAELTEHGGMIIHGRSDATLNPGGVRIGTAEIYRQVEQLPEIVESVAIGQEVGGDVRIVLFVRLRDGQTLDAALEERVRRQIRENTSPHHVPRAIVQVADIPRTISGKITELAIRDVIHGRPVTNVEALANPQALELFRDLDALRSKQG
jgi:acetoacetyl-CoA synthetase